MIIPRYYGMTPTEIVILAGVVFYSLYDCFAKLYWGDDATITVTFQKWCERDYKIAFIAGLIVGHIFLEIKRHLCP